MSSPGRPSHYRVYGGVLRSGHPIRHLPACRGAQAAAPSWILRREEDAPVPAVLEALGEDIVDAETRVRLGRTADGLLLSYDDTGSFAVERAARHIAWWPGSNRDEDAHSADVTGRVLPLALALAGRPTLHGSAVALRGRAVVFLAPKHHGKSTLAMALAVAGGRLLADDVVPVAVSQGVVTCWPGVPSLRLLGDSARHLGVRTDDGSVAVGAGGKHVVHAPGRGARAAERPASADAFYLLAPAPPSATPRRELLTGPAAVLALVGHLRLGALLGGAERARLMATLGEITRAAPVYALHVPRDFAVLPAVVEQLIAWHGGARPPARTPASA